MEIQDKIEYMTGQIDALTQISLSALVTHPKAPALIGALLEAGTKLRGQAEAGAISKAHVSGFSSVCLEAERALGTLAHVETMQSLDSSKTPH